MKRLFFQLFKRSILLCGLAPVFSAHAMITNVSKVNYVNEAGDKEKTILIFGYSTDNTGFMGLNAQKKHLKSFFEKLETNGQSVDLLIQNNVNLPKESMEQYKHSFFYNFYKKTNTSSSYNCEIENFDKTRKCIAQKLITKLNFMKDKEDNCNFIVCNLNDLMNGSEASFCNLLQYKEGFDLNPPLENKDFVKLIPSEKTIGFVNNIEKCLVVNDLSKAIANKAETSKNDTIIVHCQNDYRSDVVSNFKQSDQYQNYAVTSSTFKDYFDEASTKQKKSGEELSKKSGWEKIKNKFISFVNKYRLLPVVGVMAILGAAYLYFK